MLPLCKFCSKAMQPIGHNRKNGRLVYDWDDRSYHVKCYKEMLDTLKIVEILKVYCPDDSKAIKSAEKLVCNK